MSSIGSGETGQEITEQYQKEQDIPQHTMNGIIIIYPYRFNSGFSSIFVKIMQINRYWPQSTEGENIVMTTKKDEGISPNINNRRDFQNIVQIQVLTKYPIFFYFKEFYSNFNGQRVFS